MEEKLIKKSIFKQVKKRKYYKFIINKYTTNDWNSSYCSSIIHFDEIIPSSEEIIFTCNLEMPLLENKEDFYIEELDKTVKIMNRVRTSKENVCYYAYPEIIEDEISKQSYEDAMQQQDEYITNKNKIDKLIKEMDEKNYKISSLNKELNKLKEDILNYKHKIETGFWYNFKNKIIH